MEFDDKDTIETKKLIPAKRVNVVTIKMIKESSVLYKNRKVNSPTDAYNLIKDFFDFADREELFVCSLDTKNVPITINLCSIGTLNTSLVSPREVFKTAILSNAASILLYHNHPSGCPNPSNEDISITHRLKECGKLLGIELVDHIIVGDGIFISLKEKGIL
ncbi:DNA repair protein RadC [Clostridium estertheticum]|uniref:DNA repair protein RadC n=2 Tax=Clostridium estertheticum TaxID=238834 RepID=A0A1J0GNV0_9CLOT|nr:JAB domain-containing protein [Clostridium estertheticum]APC42598.1 DNA repair protein RadC [Clostridium estertheticum subsp. estertheticum]MBZ9614310.1 DNA repair protein RadC [Clostridium estertheticum subsp. laramiense]WAG75947.1 DNA repair protein RadC [Clostridium estertheticum]